MLKRFMVWVIVAVLVLVQNFAFPKPVQAQTLETAPTSVIQLTNNENTGILLFSDTEEFYEQLATALRENRAIKIQTSFRNYEEFPSRLKKTFEIQRLRQSSNYAAGIVADSYVPSIRAVPAKIHYGALVSAGVSTSIGAGLGASLGAFVGGIGVLPGTILGAGAGLSTWAVSQAIINNCHKVIIQIDVHGNVSITIEPVCSLIA